MVLRIAKAHFGEKVPITFPTEASKVWNEMSGLEEFGTYGTIKYIIGEGISEHFAGHITLADLNTEPGIQKINQLAELVDAMDDTTQKVFLGVLAAGSPASLDDILHAASKVGQYELIAEVSTDRELGEWLVNHGHLGTEISDTVRPYLDYPFIGAQYYKSHEGAYTPNGYVRLREPFPVLESAGPHTIQLTLTARSGELPLALPVTEAQLDQVKEALGIEDFAQASVGAVSFSPPAPVRPYPAGRCHGGGGQRAGRMAPGTGPGGYRADEVLRRAGGGAAGHVLKGPQRTTFHFKII